MVGRSEVAWNNGEHLESEAWIGKPWRRIHLLTQRFFYRGEEHSRRHDLTLHVGLRRLGVSATLILSKDDVLDYSEDTP